MLSNQYHSYPGKTVQGEARTHSPPFWTDKQKLLIMESLTLSKVVVVGLTHHYLARMI